MSTADSSTGALPETADTAPSKRPESGSHETGSPAPGSPEPARPKSDSPESGSPEPDSPAPDRPPGGRRPQSGPPLLAPVLAFAVLTLASAFIARNTPHPDASAAEVLRYAQTHHTAIAWNSFLLLGSAVPLAVTAAVLYRRLRQLGVTAPGSAITLAGGVLAAGTVSLAAAFAWTGGQVAPDGDPVLARALAELSFATGGPAFAPALALLIAGVAVTGLLVRLLPPAAGWIGLALAAAGMLATLTVLVSGFEYLIPVVRFGGALWLVYVAVALPRTRPSRWSPTRPAGQ